MLIHQDVKRNTGIFAFKASLALCGIFVFFEVFLFRHDVYPIAGIRGSRQDDIHVSYLLSENYILTVEISVEKMDTSEASVIIFARPQFAVKEAKIPGSRELLNEYLCERDIFGRAYAGVCEIKKNGDLVVFLRQARLPRYRRVSTMDSGAFLIEIGHAGIVKRRINFFVALYYMASARHTLELLILASCVILEYRWRLKIPVRGAKI